MTDTNKPLPHDQHRLNMLAAKYRVPLVNYFTRRTKNNAEAEDLAQQVFLRVMNHIDTVPDEKAEAYLFTIAGNLLRDHWRNRSTAGKYICEDDENSDYSETDQNPERQLAAQQSLEAVTAILETLPARTRDIFILRRLENMKVRDIGALYGMTKSGVDKHIAKAMVALSDRRRYGKFKNSRK